MSEPGFQSAKGEDKMICNAFLLCPIFPMKNWEFILRNLSSQWGRDLASAALTKREEEMVYAPNFRTQILKKKNHHYISILFFLYKCSFWKERVSWRIFLRLLCQMMQMFVARTFRGLFLIAFWIQCHLPLGCRWVFPLLLFVIQDPVFKISFSHICHHRTCC